MMKNRILLASLGFLPLSLPAQNFTLTGNLTGLPEGQKIELQHYQTQQQPVGSAVATKGSFTISGDVAEPAVYQLKVGETLIPMFLDKGKVTLSGNLSNAGGLNVAGAPLHEQFVKFQQAISPYTTSMQKLEADAQKTGVTDAMRQQYFQMQTQLQQQIDQFVQQNPQSPVAAWAVLATAGNENEDKLRGRIMALQPAALNTVYGKELSRRLAELNVGAIGTDAIEFSQNDASGKPVALSSFRGKYVLVDFWASWCGPCRRENPNVVAAYNRYKAKNFTILGVSFDQSKDKWLQAVAADQLAWTQVSDLAGWGNAVGKQYHITSIPQNLLIDPQGKIIAKNLRGEELERKLQELLK